MKASNNEPDAEQFIISNNLFTISAIILKKPIHFLKRPQQYYSTILFRNFILLSIAQS